MFLALMGLFSFGVVVQVVTDLLEGKDPTKNIF
jgi:hypothetical protein